MDMKDKLVSFTVARLAKEKGFDVPCYWYCSYKRKVPTHEQNFYPDIGTGKLENFNEDKGGFYERFSLPTQSLLQKWLREEHNIHCIVSPVMGVKNGYDSYPLIGWRCDVIGLNKDSTNSYYMGYPILDWFAAESLEEDETLEELNINRDNTYEEALEKGLQEGLKLIP